MKKYRIVNKYRFFTTVSLILIMIFASMFIIVVNAKSTSSEVLVPVYVSEGDNLWKLSSQFADGETDIRRYIDRVMDLNNMETANIKPGEMLLFPQNK